MLAVREIHHKEGQEKHSLVSALQITKDILCLARISSNIGRDDIHIKPFTDCFFLCVDLHTVDIGYLSLDRLDLLVLVHTADMEADENITIGIQKFGEQSVVHLGCAYLQEGRGAEFVRHRKIPRLPETEGGWGNKILDRETRRGKPAPFKGKPFAVRVEDTVQHLQLFFTRKFFCQGTHHLKMSQGVGYHTGKPRPRRLDILCLDGKDKVFCFDTAVVSFFKLTAEHLRIALADMIETVSLGRDLDALDEILPVHAVAHKGEFHTDRSVVRVIHIAEGFKDCRLIVGLGKLIIYVLKLDTARPAFFIQTAKTVRVHLTERQGILRRSCLAVALRIFNNAPDLTLFSVCQLYLRSCRLRCLRLFSLLFGQQPSPPFLSAFAALLRHRNCLSDRVVPSFL